MLSRFRLVVDTFAAVTSAALLVVTLVEPHWFELLFDLTPDDGDGSLEALFAIVVLMSAAAFFVRRCLRGWTRGPDMAAPDA